MTTAMAERKYRSMSDMQREANGGAEPKGIPCPQCGSTRRRIFRTTKDDGMVLRETQCMECPHKQFTKEIPA